MADFSSTQTTTAFSGGFRLQPQDGLGFRLKVRIRAGHVPLQTMRLQSRLVPHPHHGRVTHPYPAGQAPRRPVGHGRHRQLLGSGQDGRLLLGPQLLGSAGSARIQQTVQALLLEPLLPVPLAAGTHPRFGPARPEPKGPRPKKQDLCPAHPARGQVGGAHNAFQVLSLLSERNLEKSPQHRQMELQSFSRGRYAP
jgi:hypothetical protein